jgi:hypothetical protein
MISKKSHDNDVIDLNKPHTCEFCHKSFSKESTLVSHVCENKRRWQNQNTSYVKKGYLAYQLFHQSLTPHKTVVLPTYQQFAASNYYTSFTKFGSWCEENQIQEWQLLVKWLLKNNKKLDLWCDWLAYQQFLQEIVNDEPPQQALKRSLDTIAAWSKDSGNTWTEFFERAHPNIIVNWIIQGKISPWFLYNCHSAVNFLEKCNQEQLNMLQAHAPIRKWKVKFMRMQEDADVIKQTLEQAGM